MPRPPILIPILGAACLVSTAGCAQTEPAVIEAQTASADTTEPERPTVQALPETVGPVMVGPLTADAAVTDARQLVGAMHGRYGRSWYRTLTFTQATYRKGPDGSVSEETWREWAALPGRLRIEMDDPMEGTDALYARDSLFVYRDGALAAARPERNPLLLWGFDVYAQPPAETLRILEEEGYSLDAFREDTWNGRPAYVLGVPESGEVWVDRERLLFVRLVEPGADGQLQDVRFEDYRPLAGGWIAPRVEVWVDGDRVFWEEYSDVEAGATLDPVLFDPRRWSEAVEGSKADG